MRTYFTTNNYWRFTWKRQALGGILIHSIPTTLEYYRLDGCWRRSYTRSMLRSIARIQLYAAAQEAETNLEP